MNGKFIIWRVKKMTKKEFSCIREQLPQFKYTSLEYAVYEIIERYELLQNDSQAVLMYGMNKEAEILEMHFAVNNMQLIIDKIKSMDTETLVTFIPPEYKYELLQQGFTVYGELQDYWIENLSNRKADDSGICFIKTDEYTAASEVTKSVKNQSREFHGETPEWIENARQTRKRAL